MNLIKQIITSFSNTGIGLGIGSQISQICGVYYPTPIDNYCKIVKQCEFYGRHMDDFYIIHNSKEFLQKLLVDIEKITDELGLTLNNKKTQICRIDKGFVYLKQFIFMTESGKIVCKPYKKNIVRERRKLKSFKIKVDNKEMNASDVENIYKSWRGSIRRYNSYHIIQNMDGVYYKSFNTS